MDDLEGLAELCAVVENQSFTRAADELGVSASNVSRKISALETRLGLRLLHRTTRSVNLTDLGAQYYERASAILADIRTLSSDLSEQQNQVKGLIRVTAGGVFAETCISEALAEFALLHPKVQIEFDISERRTDLIRERFDIAIRHGMPTDPDLKVRKLVERNMIVCASPGYIRKHGRPETPQDLLSHSCLSMPGVTWPFSAGAKTVEIKVRGRWQSGNGRALATAAIKGLGITRLAETYVQQAIADGTLVSLLNKYQEPPQQTVLVYPTRQYMPYRIRCLLDFLVERAAPC